MKERLANVIVSVQGRGEKIVCLKYGSVVISGDMVEDVPLVVVDNKQLNGKERKRERETEERRD